MKCVNTRKEKINKFIKHQPKCYNENLQGTEKKTHCLPDIKIIDFNLNKAETHTSKRNIF